MAEIDRGRYQSDLFAGVRFVSQELLLKPFIWRILTVNVHGLMNIEGLDAPFVVIANHSSHLDAPLIVGALPRRLTKFLATGAAADYFYASKLKSLSTALVANTYPIERRGLRTRKGLSKLLLTDGVPLLIFPEGTRSRTGAMGPFTPGVAALCISHNAPALPIALVGAYAAWPYGQGHLPRGRPEVHVVIGHPLTPAPGEIARQFNERMRRTVQQLHDSTARAYGLPTLDDYARAVSLRQASVPSAVSPVSPPHVTEDDGGKPAGKDRT
jgi:1-acyl-sn-glycerol-3-phosphate acyltransferase